MPNTNIWLGCTDSVAQVCSATPANVEVGDTFTLTLTDDQGNTAAVSFIATAATVANVTAGLTAAWNASTDPLLTGITAADVTTYLSLTADTAGAPFSVAGTAVNGGAADTQTLTVATTTANKGPNDWGVADNWLLGAAPVDTDNVIVPAGAPSILYGLNQSAVALGTVDIQEGYAGNIGRFDAESGLLHYLRIDPDALTIRGSGGLVAINIGAAAIAPVIDHTGSPSATGRQTVYLKGTAITTVHQYNGTSGVATFGADTATVTAGFNVAGGTMTIGSGVTVTGTTAEAYNGTIVARASVPTVKVHDNGTYEQEAGVWTALTAYDGATVKPNAAGTYAATTTYGAVTLDLRETLNARTFTAATNNGNLTIYDPAKKGTVGTWTEVPGTTRTFVGAS